MEKKKGFTLIELLAVIVILAIIALIAVPVILNMINKANKSAFKDTAYGIMSAGELYFAGQQLELNGMLEEAEFTFPTNEIDIKGEVPAGTMLKVNTNGEIALAMTNGRYCITKGYADKDITITEEFTECDISTEVKTLRDLAVVSTKLGINSIEACLNDGTECEPGTPFAIKVNNTDTYKFRVLNDENDVVTLIMASNLYEEGNKKSPEVSWIDITTYSTENNKDEVPDYCDYDACNDEGPITALKALKERTTTWKNIEKNSYTLDYGTGTYSEEYVQNVRARLPRLSDFINDKIECTQTTKDIYVCPDWTYENLCGTGDNNTSGYWLSDAESDPNHPDLAWFVYEDGDIGAYDSVASIYGVRPVIVLTK